MTSEFQVGPVDVSASTTVRDQMGALAAAAAVARCGAGSPMVAVMGRGHAAWLVRTLWADLVRPTLRLFVVDVTGVCRQGPDTACRVPHGASFRLSPLLLGVACGPRLPPTPYGTTRVGPGSISLWLHRGRGMLAVCDLLANSMPRREAVPVANAPWDGHVVGSRWAATVGRTRNPVASAKAPGSASKHIDAEVSLTVAEMIRGVAVSAGGCLCGCGDDGDLGYTVVVGVPQFAGSEGRVQMFPDQSVESEVIVTHSTANRTLILVVDVEQTHNSRSLAVLSTTRCEFPPGYLFQYLVVMRNWGQCSSSPFGSRTFIVTTHFKRSFYEVFRVQEHTAIFMPIMRHVSGVFSLSDSLFCLSFYAKKLRDYFYLYHFGDPTHPHDIAQSFPYPKSCKQVKAKRFLAKSGLMFRVLVSNVIEVIEPKTGFLCLTIGFPGLKSIEKIMAPLRIELRSIEPKSPILTILLRSLPVLISQVDGA
ncbi:hypothetical protein Pelo_913 [Pelomyxa schiedti]|nr:hypothetical protein Pelo_913 [Pelomyxa schiedti]